MKPLASDLHLELYVPDQTLACGNAEEVREAIVTVIDNAVKYAPGSPIDVRVTKSASAVVIEVADAGPGMLPEERERAFERFHRGFHPNVEGSGLGLAIAKRAVERARGRITLTGEPGAGTTVTMYLPSATAGETAAESTPTA
jgi:signal transduction histidine kinase